MSSRLYRREDMDKIRVLRVIEYIGPRDKVEEQISKSLQGSKKLPNGIEIKVATIGNYPEVLENLPEDELKNYTD